MGKLRQVDLLMAGKHRGDSTVNNKDNLTFAAYASEPCVLMAKACLRQPDRHQLSQVYALNGVWPVMIVLTSFSSVAAQSEAVVLHGPSTEEVPHQDQIRPRLV